MHAGDSRKEDKHSGMRQTLYMGTSQRPLQLRPSTHLATRSMSAAASDGLDQDGSMHYSGTLTAQDDHTDDPDKLTAQHECIQHSNTSAQQIMSAQMAQHRQSTGWQPAVATNRPAPHDNATSGAAEPGEADGRNEPSRGAEEPIHKCYSSDGYLSRPSLTRRPSAAHGPVMCKAVVAAAPVHSHQLTEQSGSELVLPLHSESGRAELLQASDAGPVPIMPVNAHRPLVEQALQPESTATDSDDELDDLLELQPSETFLRNWNQHTSFHRRRQQAQEEAGDEEDAESSVSDAESVESLSLNSNADQRQDSSRKAARSIAKQAVKEPVSGESCNKNRRATRSKKTMLENLKAVPGKKLPCTSTLPKHKCHAIKF